MRHESPSQPEAVTLDQRPGESCPCTEVRMQELLNKACSAWKCTAERILAFDDGFQPGLFMPAMGNALPLPRKTHGPGLEVFFGGAECDSRVGLFDGLVAQQLLDLAIHGIRVFVFADHQQIELTCNFVDECQLRIGHQVLH